MIHLINPSEQGILENAGDRIPIGLLSIGANLKSQGQDVRVFDLNHMSREDYFKQASNDRPEMIGISVYTSPIYDRAIDLAENLRGISPESQLVAGGYHASFMPSTLTDDFDTVIVGDGENMLDARGFRGIKLGRRADLSILPNPDRSLLDMSQYGVNQHRHRTATLITSRGCPYECAFCGNLERTVRFESPSKVRGQMEQAKEEGFDALYFLDDVFTLNRDRLRLILEGNEMPYRFTTRANLVDASRLRILANTGAEMMSIGIESGNDEILKKANKRMSTRDNKMAVRTANVYGIKTKGFFIIGLPGETENTARQTIEFAEELRDEGLEQADFYFLTPFPGTPIWKNPEKFGIKIRDRNWRKYLQAGNGAKCLVDTEELKAERIEELVNEARDRWKN